MNLLSKKIICTDTGEIFDNYIEANKRFDAKHKYNIPGVCSGKYNNYKGYHFQFYEEGKEYEKTERRYNYKTKSFKCLETGEVFSSLKQLDGYYGQSSIRINLVNPERSKSACGLHWKYTEEEPTDISKTLALIDEYAEQDFVKNRAKAGSLTKPFEERYNISISKGVITCNTCGYVWRARPTKKRNLSCPNCHPSEHGSSRGECELHDILAATGLNVIHNDRKTLGGKELDIYFPDLKLAIEYDGRHWHSKEDDELKNELCKELGIKLIRVDNDEWLKDREPVLERILPLLGNPEINWDLVPDIVRTSGKCRKIICTDTGEIFDSYLEASKKFNSVVLSNIPNVCIGNFPHYNGYHFKYYEEGKTYERTRRQFEYKYRRVKCIETGEVFESVSALRYKYGVTSIDGCLLGKQKTACGLHWEYTDDDITDVSETLKLISEHSKTVRVRCIDTGEIYESVKDAAKKIGVHRATLSKHLNGKSKTTNGLRFEYLDKK